MSPDKKIHGLSLKVSPLGENDRLLTLLSEEEGIIRIAIPGGRRPKSSLAATSALTFLELQIVGRANLRRARQIKVIKSFSQLGKELETLAAAQTLTELSLLLVATNDPQPEFLKTVLFHLERLKKPKIHDLEILANCVQACFHLLALGGYGLPVQECCLTREKLNPPIGNWDWVCSFITLEGFAIGLNPNSAIRLNASEMALLQRLLNPSLPINKAGELLGPLKVWIKLLNIVELWIGTHLNKNPNALKLLKDAILSKNNFLEQQDIS